MLERLMLRAAEASLNGTTTVDPLAAIDPHVLTGPMLIGLVLNVWLFGMQLMQVEVYVRSNTRDPTWIKALVWFLLLVDTVNSVFDAWFTYDYNVNKFGDKLSIISSTWVFNTDPVMTVISSSSVQMFFGWRVQKLTGQTWITAMICVSAIIQFFAGLGTSIACGIVQHFEEFHKFKSIVIVWLVLAPFTDIMISLTLVIFLQKNKTGFAVTDDLVTRITRVTVQTGAITAIWSAVDLTIFLCFSNNLHLIFNMPLAKLYSNCLMSSLNARRHWGGSSNTSDQGGISGNGNGRKDRVIHVTTTLTGVQESYELDSRGRPYDGVSPAAAPRPSSIVGDVKRKPIDDGLSLKSDSIGSDDDGVDVLGSHGLRKLRDEEAVAANMQLNSNQPFSSYQPSPTPPRNQQNVAFNLDSGPGQRHPFVNVVGSNVPSPQLVARGGKTEHNLEWSTAL